MAEPIQNRIGNHIKSMKRGSVIFPSTFDNFGNVEIVKKSRLRLESVHKLRAWDIKIKYDPDIYRRDDCFHGERNEVVDFLDRL